MYGVGVGKGFESDTRKKYRNVDGEYLILPEVFAKRLRRTLERKRDAAKAGLAADPDRIMTRSGVDDARESEEGGSSNLPPPFKLSVHDFVDLEEPQNRVKLLADAFGLKLDHISEVGGVVVAARDDEIQSVQQCHRHAACRELLEFLIQCFCVHCFPLR